MKPFIILQHDSPAMHTSARSCENSAAFICTQQSKGQSAVSGGLRRVNDHVIFSNAACDYKFDAKVMERILLHTSHRCPRHQPGLCTEVLTAYNAIAADFQIGGKVHSELTP